MAAGRATALRAMLCLATAPAIAPAAAQTPSLVQRNCNNVWGDGLTADNGLNFFNVSTAPTSGTPLVTSGSNTRGAAMAIDGRTGYLYVIQDDLRIVRYDGRSGGGTQVVDMDGAGANPSAGNRYARATIVNGILLIMSSGAASSTGMTAGQVTPAPGTSRTSAPVTLSGPSIRRIMRHPSSAP
ncbi:hypothetical protein [Lysobacter silvisoli]|uniref:Uncharacterized protein n=1 Tax=Lysobacter silvisoli TaxID=2293254 RepID=A0A371JY13_9GAMM|nr:hypothetical protein [Lysobacter silvisoli]RDZ26492.1 hypothetical protein DX914_15995 [Lysobacter silvisoli]